MKTVDVNLFEGDPFVIKTKGKTYTINFISAIMELKLMQDQEDITTKSAKWKLLEQQDIVRWQSYISKIIQENAVDFDEKDITGLRPIDILGILMALISYLQERSKIIYEGLSPEVKKEVEKATDDLKKKTLGTLS
jgi:hypothetical protein